MILGISKDKHYIASNIVATYSRIFPKLACEWIF